MFNRLCALFARKTNHRRSGTQQSRRCLRASLESLEDRRLLSVTPAALHGGLVLDQYTAALVDSARPLRVRVGNRTPGEEL